MSNEVQVPVPSPTLPPKRAVSIALIASGVTIALLGIGGFVASSRYNEANSTNNPVQFAKGVSVAGVALGGLTREQGREKVRQWAIAQLQNPVTFAAPQSGRTWNLTLATVGGRFSYDAALDSAFHVGKDLTTWQKVVQGSRDYTHNFAPEFRLNETALGKEIAKIGAVVNRPAQNATARITDKGQITLAKPEQKGVQLNETATKSALLKNGVASLQQGGKVTLAIGEVRPALVAADLGKMGVVLASYTTDYSSSPSARWHNVELAASKVHGILLAPGEEFSYNKVVGPREARYGWQNALMFEDGEVVPGMGGGVCQVSSTLYNAVLRADLKVTARQNHSIKVKYVRPGSDATVVYGALDFRFLNTTDGPVMILARTRRGELTLNLYGTKPVGKQIEIVSGPMHYNSDGDMTVTLYKVTKTADGKTTREYLHTDSYQSPKPKRSEPRKVARRVRPALSSPVIPAANKTTAPSAPPRIAPA